MAIVGKRLLAALCGLACALCVAVASAEVVIVVSTDSRLETLSRTQLTDIYLGRLNRLASGEAIVPVDQSDRSPTHEVFYRQYIGQTPAQIRAHWSRLIFTGRGQPPRTVQDDSAMADLVATNPNAIGYLDMDHVDDSLRVVTIETPR